MDRRPHLVISGFMGAGKTTVGRRVAERAGVPFVDLDDRIGPSPPGPLSPSGRGGVGEVFERIGEAAFRRLEAEELREVLAMPAPSVIAVGGGALIDPASRALALASARVVTLVASPKTLRSRVTAPESVRRPLLEIGLDPGDRVRDLLASRAAVYAEAHAQISSDRAAIDEVAAAVERAWAAPAIAVQLAERSYAVRFTGDASAGRITADALAALTPTKVFVVTDANVETRWGAAFLGDLAAAGFAVARPPIVLTPGEANKQLAAVEHICRALLAGGADRGAVIVAHGGGVVSDIAGFAAAIWMRGARWISVPTTLLAMADASVGGKTGVDLDQAKNALGAFHQPSAVVIDVSQTATEPEAARRSGMAEILKAAVIGDADLFEFLEKHSGSEMPPEALAAAVAGAIRVKARIVGADERESGPRAWLNFGHTLGHALEAAGGFSRWRHGEAVSLGMIAAARVGLALGVTPPALVDRITAALRACGLPVALDAADVEAALPFVGADKKRRGADVSLVVVPALGKAALRAIEIDALKGLFRGAALRD